MQNELLRAAWAEIDLDALRYNIENIKKLIKPGVEMIGVVKADGYGCDSVVIAKVLMEEGVKRFAVATLEEGIKLRRGIKDVMIVVLGLLPDKFAEKAVEYDLTPTVDSYSNAKAFSDAAVQADRQTGCFVAVDSGMGRIGLIADDHEQADVVRRIADLPNLTIEAVSTHFSTADWYDKGYAHLQQKKFDAFYAEIEKRGVKGLPRTASNSAGIMELPEADYEMVRPGIFMSTSYGLYDNLQEQGNPAAEDALTVAKDIHEVKKEYYLIMYLLPDLSKFLILSGSVKCFQCLIEVFDQIVNVFDTC
jgi:alanine racemase